MVQTLVVPDPLADLARLPGVPAALAAARDAVDLVVRDGRLRAVGSRHRAQALLLGAQASGRLSADPDRAVAGAIRLSSELVSLSAVLSNAPAQALARAHVLAAHGTADDDGLGRLRDGPGLPDRMDALSRLLTRPTAAPAMVLAAVAHAEIAVLAPFGAADDLVARAAERMVLIGWGVDPYGVVASEVGHLARADAYRQGLDAYAAGTAAGLRQWLLHCAAAVTDGAAAAAGLGSLPTDPLHRVGHTLTGHMLTGHN